MTAHLPRHLLAFVSLVLVVLLVVLDLERAAPGPLSRAHAQVEELAGSKGCAACHGAGADDLRRACLACHETLGTQLAASTGFHGTLEAPETCGRCHVEHAPVEVPLVTPEAFAFAGVPERDAFRHEKLAFGLHGAHERLACAECHANADVETLAVGDVRFLGLAQDCAGCHETPHDETTSTDCASCHGQNGPFDVLEDYEHDPRFPLEGAHAGLGCYDCHEPGTRFSVGRERSAPPAAARTCAACHESPHAQPFVRAAALAADVVPHASCGECHAPEPGGFTTSGSRMTRAQHDATGFALAAPHADVSCDACHAPELAREARFPGRSGDDCAACHDDPHAGQFARPTHRGATCLDCHDRSGFAPHGFDAELHARTAFPLDGAHARTDCNACHEPDLALGVRRFRDTPSTCSDCHVDVHGGAFEGLALAGGDAPSERTDCTRCHTTEDFAEPLAGAFDHARDAGFALLGRHADATCEACHVASAASRELFPERTLGFVSHAFPGPPERCDTCHEDVHEGRFAAGPEPAPDCAACHDERGFEHAREADFDHGRWTGFALAGAHARAECASCHGAGDTLADARTLGRVAERFPGPTERCDTCHADPHAGMFLRDPVRGSRTDCASCHGVEAFEGRNSSAFDHAGWTGFVLEGAHEAASCAACHPTSPPDPSGRTFGRALGAACADCHADPHLGQFRAADQVGARVDCARCHLTDPGFAAPLFDHDRDSRFPLDATHAPLECRVCHKAWRTADGVEAVRYKPLGRECSDCHLPGTGGRR